jgi:hypothetical protein
MCLNDRTNTLTICGQAFVDWLAKVTADDHCPVGAAGSASVCCEAQMRRYVPAALAAAGIAEMRATA